MISIYERPYLYNLMYLDYRADIQFMVWLAKNYSSGVPILEMACGTLRVTTELAKAGCQVVGVDISQPMISYGLNELEEESHEVRERVSIRLGDMRDAQVTGSHYNDHFPLPQIGTYNLAVVPFTAFLHLLTRDDQLQTLANIRDHLAPGGYFLADIFNPRPSKLDRMLLFEKEVIDEKNHERLFRWSSSAYDEVTQTARWVFISEVFGANGGSKMRVFSEETVSIIFPDQWRQLLTESGFKITEEWGDFDRSPFDPSVFRRMLFLCQKA